MIPSFNPVQRRIFIMLLLRHSSSLNSGSTSLGQVELSLCSRESRWTGLLVYVLTSGIRLPIALR